MSLSAGKSQVPSQFDRILIFNSAFPGDIVLTTPLVRAVYESFPGAYLGFCTTPAGAHLLSGLSYLDRLIVYDKNGRDKGLTGLIRAALGLRREKFDLALCAHRSVRSAVLLGLAGIPFRVGFAQSQAPWLFTRTVNRDPAQHETCRNLQLLQPLGLDPARLSVRPCLPVTDEEAARVFDRLGAAEPDGRGPLVAVAPGSVWGTKRWLAARFAGLVDLLASTLSARVILVGGPLDRPAADEVLAASRTPLLDLVGKTDLRALAALIRRSDLVVTGDSAPMHVAWAFDIPTVAIFGATTPELGFAPLSERCRVVEVKGLVCRPCSAHGPQRCPLGHFRCMHGITVDMVLSACEEVLRVGRPAA
jgi:heptosyltransferase II